MTDLPRDILRDVWGRLEAPDRMALDLVLPDDAKMATATDRRLALLAYADRNGKLTNPSKENIDFLQRNVGTPTADKLLEKHANVTLKLCRLEHAIARGVYGPRDDYPSDADLDDFNMWYGLCMTLGRLSPEKFEAFLQQRELVSAVLFGPHKTRFQAFLESCEPVLLEYVLYEEIFFRNGDVPARKNRKYLQPETVRMFMDRGLGPERWARYLEIALSAGAMDVVDMVMTEGYRLDGTRVPPAPKIDLAKTKAKTPVPRKGDPCERCFTSMYCALLVAALVYIARV